MNITVCDLLLFLFYLSVTIILFFRISHVFKYPTWDFKINHALFSQIYLSRTKKTSLIEISMKQNALQFLRFLRKGDICPENFQYLSKFWHLKITSIHFLIIFTHYKRVRDQTAVLLDPRPVVTHKSWIYWHLTQNLFWLNEQKT